MSHKKTFINLIIIVFFMSFCSIGLALSISAENTINNIRARLKNVSISIKKPAKKGAYVPGQQLRLALNRLREKLHQAPIPTPKRSFSIPKKTLLETNYIPGKELASRLKKVYKIIGKNPDIKTKEIFPKITDLKKNLRIDAGNDRKKIDTYISESRITPFANSLKLYHKLPESKVKVKKATHKKRKVIKAKKVVRKAIKHQKVSNTIKTRSSIKATNKMTNNEIKRFNETIRNNEFKMPRNYRIIVR